MVACSYDNECVKLNFEHLGIGPQAGSRRRRMAQIPKPKASDGALASDYMEKARLVYLRNQWPKLIRYVDDGKVAIDTNLAERASTSPRFPHGGLSNTWPQSLTVRDHARS
jgi:Transposase IS66 family